jgi:hypothetical protein
MMELAEQLETVNPPPLATPATPAHTIYPLTLSVA